MFGLPSAVEPVYISAILIPYGHQLAGFAGGMLCFAGGPLARLFVYLGLALPLPPGLGREARDRKKR